MRLTDDHNIRSKAAMTVAAAVLALVFSSCGVDKYLNEGERVLNRNQVTTLMDDGTAPGALSMDFQLRYGGDDRAVEILSQKAAVNAVAALPFPYVSLPEEKWDAINALQNEIGYFVDTQFARWVLGEDEISDASFAAFERALNEMGLSAFLTLWQEALISMKQ